MIDDVFDLLCGKANIYGVENGPHRRNGQIGLQMFLRVPAQCPHALTRLKAESLECGGKLMRAPCNLIIGCLAHRFTIKSEDLASTE